jgi:hypothetical protein
MYMQSVQKWTLEKNQPIVKSLQVREAADERAHDLGVEKGSQ